MKFIFYTTFGYALLSTLWMAHAQAARYTIIDPATGRDAYDILRIGRPEAATQEDLASQYKKLAKLFHPDRAKDDPNAEQEFKNLANAYQVVETPEKRLAYDQKQTAQLVEALIMVSAIYSHFETFMVNEVEGSSELSDQDALIVAQSYLNRASLLIQALTLPVFLEGLYFIHEHNIIRKQDTFERTQLYAALNRSKVLLSVLIKNRFLASDLVFKILDYSQKQNRYYRGKNITTAFYYEKVGLSVNRLWHNCSIHLSK